MRKSKFLMSPGLYDYYYNFDKSVFSLHGIFFLITIILSDYPDLLISIDLAIVVLALAFRFVGRSLIMKGFPAYYSSNYQKGLFPVFFAIAPYIYFGAYIRLFVLGLYYGASLMLTTGKDAEFLYYVTDMKRNATDVEGLFIGLLLFALKIYILYYHDRYISIKEFSDRSMKLVMERNMHIDMAMELVMRNKEKELEMKALGKVIYDEGYKTPFEMIMEEIHRQEHQDQKEKSYHSNDEDQRKQQQEAFTPVRRQARD